MATDRMEEVKLFARLICKRAAEIERTNSLGFAEAASETIVRYADSMKRIARKAQDEARLLPPEDEVA